MALNFTQAAETAFGSLNSRDQKVVLRKLEILAFSQRRSTHGMVVGKLHKFVPPVYALNISKGGLLVLFRYSGGQIIQVVDIVRRERILRMYKHTGRRRI